MNTLEIIKPDDWHVHFRESPLLEKLVPETSKVFNRAIVMPNLIKPITNSKIASSYKKKILKYSTNNSFFDPLITFYLNDEMSINELVNAFKEKIIFAAKLYPLGATTNSSKGVSEISKMFNIFEKMSEHKIPLLIHGEVNQKDIDVFDREKVFIENHLIHIYKNFPDLKITLEHITTKFAVDFVNEASNNLKASITPHHLILNRTDMLAHKIKPHYYCLPILKKEVDRKALLKAAFNKNQKFFLGTDSAPHDVKDKENQCGCAGVFNTINSIETLAQLFEDNGMLNSLENFVSRNGAIHYELPLNTQKIKLRKKKSSIIFENFLKIKNFNIKIFRPPFNVFWEIENKGE